MIHALSIYKFSFPFIQYRYEKAIFHETVSDFEKLLKYQGSYLKTIESKSSTYKKSIVYFEWWHAEFYFNNSEDYYIPRHQYELFFDDKPKLILIKDIIKIFNTLWLHNYIFDFETGVEEYINNKNIITERVLEKWFSVLLMKNNLLSFLLVFVKNI